MEKKISVTRVFSAPVELVWKTWVEPELVMRWWGPDVFSSPMAKIDFREGGRSLVCMRAPAEMGGNDIYSIWEYKKIVPLQSIEFVQNLADKNGNKMQPVKLGMPPDFPEDVRTVVVFKNLGDDKTEMTVTEYADFGQTNKFAQIGLEQSIGKMLAIFVIPGV